MINTQLLKTSSCRFNPLLNNSGTALIMVVMVAFIGSLTIGAVTLSNQYSLKKSGVRTQKVGAFNIAEAGKERVIAELRYREFNPRANQSAAPYTDVPIGDGSYSVSCSTNITNDTILITSVGKNRSGKTTLETRATMEPDWSRWIRGAVTVRFPVSTLGSIRIDGREYDTTGGIFGTLLGTGGTVGISSGGAVSVGGSSTVGGNFTAPQQATMPGVTVEENIDTTGYPQTPEEVLGVPPGSLDKYKVSSAPPSNYFGIVYSDQPYDFAGGIMICHNESGTASLGNYHGHFKGLIIADEVKHFNSASSVLGAVFMLGKDASANCFGNGAARIHFSSRMLAKVLNTLSLDKRDIEVISSREVE